MSSAVSTVVVTYNSESVIDSCLASLSHSGVPTRVIVVDNHSTDRTVQNVRDRFPDVVVVESGDNLGFSGGCNLGALRARADGARFIFFLNPDAAIASDCVEKLVAALEADNTLGVVSPIVVQGQNGRIQYAGADLDFDALDFGVRGRGEPFDSAVDDVVRTGRPEGAAMMMPTSALDAVGPLNESYFLYWEECEWAWRCRNAGFGVGLVRGTHVTHHANHSTGGAMSPQYEYYFTRNVLTLVGSARATSRVATLVHMTPYLVRRVLEQGPRRHFARARTMVRYDLIGIADFWRSRSGRRADL